MDTSYSYVSSMGGEAGAGSDADHSSSTSNMQIAFQQFMLQSKNNQANKQSIKQESKISKEERLKVQQEKQQQHEINKLQSELKKGEKQYWSIFHRFCNLLLNQWVDIDDQLLLVLQSISGIRQRLPIQTKILQKFRDDTILHSNNNNEWKNHAHNQQLTTTSSNTLLSQEDVELAFTHDMQQHEKMMEGLRSLFANLSEMHESMSRALDEMFKHQLNQEEQILSTQEYSKHYTWLSLTSYHHASSLIHLTTELFHMFSLELYRKQSLVQFVLYSADDRVLLPGEEEKSYGQGSGSNIDDEWYRAGPKVVVDHCLKYWPRSCHQSCIDTALYDLAMKKHERKEISLQIMQERIRKSN